MKPSHTKKAITRQGHNPDAVLADYLLERNAGPIIATTRDPAKLADLAARGVDVCAADFDRPETLKAAFAGADRLLLISTDAVYVPGQRVAQHKAAVAAAEAAGVGHIVTRHLSRQSPTATTSSKTTTSGPSRPSPRAR